MAIVSGTFLSEELAAPFWLLGGLAVVLARGPTGTAELRPAPARRPQIARRRQTARRQTAGGDPRFGGMSVLQATPMSMEVLLATPASAA